MPEARGICHICQMVNPALGAMQYIRWRNVHHQAPADERDAGNVVCIHRLRKLVAFLHNFISLQMW